jgi:Rad3-related DNA helicase
VIFIDLEHKLPTDADLPDKIRWSTKDWNDWINKSNELVNELARLDAAGEREKRNDLIEKNCGHWGKLKPWLLHLSHGKCWFTEARDIASHLDVEHFRPKKAARNVKGPERDGYWWLAFDYMNFRIAGNVPNRKKGAWFPLRYGSTRSTYKRRCERDEIPHFLDPTSAHDVALLAFDEEGKAIPAPGADRWDYVRARRTIDRLKLSEHQALAEERRKVWQRTSRLINDYLNALSNSRFSAAERERAHSSARDLARMMKADEELSSVAKWCIRMRNDPKLLRLVG